MSDDELRMYYIGACSLLGRIARHIPKGDPDRFPIEMAMKDCARLVNMDLVPCSGGAWSLEPKRVKP